MGKTKRFHYVPQFYQRGFAHDRHLRRDEGKGLKKFLLYPNGAGGKRFVPSATKHTLQSRSVHSLTHEIHVTHPQLFDLSDDLEEQLSRIEGALTLLYQQDALLTTTDIKRLCWGMFIQMLRMPQVVESYVDSFGTARVKQIVNKEDGVAISDDDAKAFIKLAWLGSMPDAATELFGTLIKTAIIVDARLWGLEKDFLLPDVPVIQINKDREILRTRAISYDTKVFVYPLNSKRVLICSSCDKNEEPMLSLLACAFLGLSANGVSLGAKDIVDALNMVAIHCSDKEVVSDEKNHDMIVSLVSKVKSRGLLYPWREKLKSDSRGAPKSEAVGAVYAILPLEDGSKIFLPAFSEFVAPDLSRRIDGRWLVPKPDAERTHDLRLQQAIADTWSPKSIEDLRRRLGISPTISSGTSREFFSSSISKYQDEREVISVVKREIKIKQ